ncbi:unnamed protein product [Brassica oleracea]
MQPPVLPEDGTTRLTAGDEASSSTAVKDTSVPEPIWDDEDTKTFYECLPDLRAFVPAVLLGEAETKSSEQSSNAKEKLSVMHLVDNACRQTTEDTAEVLDDSGTMPDGLNIEQPKEKDEVDKEKAKDAKKEKGKEKDSEKEKGKSLDVANFERLLQRLPGCVSRDLIDQLTACLDDFSHHNIDVACNLLETCGRFLYRSPETTLRMTNMLDILMRLKNVKNLDPRQSTLVENAYYLCKLPERSARISNVRPPLHQGEYGQIHLIASLTSGLSRHHEEFAVAIVDELCSVHSTGLFEILWGAVQLRARRLICDIRDALVDSFIWLRMVIILLETCGHYFDRGSSKKRLDQFLIHFQRYVLSKGHLPLDIEFDLQENIEQRKLELRGRSALNMTIPMSAFEGSGKDHHHFIGENGEEVMDEENGEPREVQVKGGNKQQTKQMLIPSDCSLVQSTRHKEAADLEEKQDIKRLLLEYNERDEEEANGLGTQVQKFFFCFSNVLA